MTFIEEKIRLSCENLQNRIIREETPISGIRTINCAYKTENVPPKEDAGWADYQGEVFYMEKDTHCWFTFDFEVPEADENYEYRLVCTTGTQGWDACNPQGTLFLNGITAYQAFDVNHTDTPVKAGKYHANLYFYRGMESGNTHLQILLRKIDLRIEKVYYDLSVPYNAMRCQNADTDAYNTICTYLDRACLLLDFRHAYSDDFYAGLAACEQFLTEEFYGKVCGGNGKTISLIGHTHIDVAWLWTLAQTAEKSQRSFSTVIRLMEKYPDYIFMSSQPQLYEYVKENDPELYEKIKEMVRQGRWEPDGAMWLEADTNLISGESLVRQLLFGKRFMREEFGVENRMLWLPDVFGYSAALPQILKKSGVDYFFTTKISWSETDKFPHDSFIWRGIDGSEVFSSFAGGYVNRLKPDVVANMWANYKDKKYSSVQIGTFGYGDGGGGPTAEMLENYTRLEKGIPGLPAIRMQKSFDTILEIEKEFRDNTRKLRFVPTWHGELYLEMHRGTYTSIAQNKKFNRKSELLYQTAETLSVIDSLTVGTKTYPQETFYWNWKTILKNQFHDIIPGSSIKEVYDFSKKEYEKVLADGRQIVEDKLTSIAKNMKTDGGLMVYNPAPFAADVPAEGGVVKNVPAHGWKVVKAAEAAAKVTAEPYLLENDFVRVRFDEAYHVISIYDKKNGREVMAPGAKGNQLNIYEDYPREYDAWEITEYYKQKVWPVDQVDSAEVYRDGAAAGIRVTRTYYDSVITQKMQLSPVSARLDFITDVDWHEDHVFLRASFPFDVQATHANYNIQFGHIERPTHRNTSWDQAQFEVSAHKWADISEADYGVSLLNDCKYGYSAEENVLSISLLKAATYPNPEADRGHHSFTYSVLPHAGALGLDTVREGYLLNIPAEIRTIEKAEGTLPECFSLVTSSDPDFVIETVKLAEDGSGYILRGYESTSRKVRTRLDFGFDVARVCLCDLMENELEELPAESNAVTISARNFEIITLKIVKA